MYSSNDKTPALFKISNIDQLEAFDFSNAKSDINETGEQGETFLHRLTADKNYALAKTLIDKGAKVEVADNNGNTPLHVTALNGSNAIAKALLINGADVNVKNNDGDTPLHLAIKNNYIKLAELLLVYKANLGAVNKAGNTPLHEAVLKGDVELVELLLNYKVDTKIFNKENKSALDIAIENNDTIVFNKLLFLFKFSGAIYRTGPFGSSIQRKYDENKSKIIAKALITAIKCKNIKMIKSIIECGYDVNVVDKDGNTPLHIASQLGYYPIVKLLLSAGAYINVLNKDIDKTYPNGKTPFDVAQNVDIKELFVRQKASIIYAISLIGLINVPFILNSLDVNTRLPVSNSTQILDLIFIPLAFGIMANRDNEAITNLRNIVVGYTAIDIAKLAVCDKSSLSTDYKLPLIKIGIEVAAAAYFTYKSYTQAQKDARMEKEFNSSVAIAT